MRKRVFGSIFITSLVTLLLTTGLLLLAVHAGLTNDMRRRLVTESSYLSAVDNIGEELEKFGSVYADRLTLVAQDGTVMYDNRTNASEMENHAVRPEIAAAEKNGTGEDNRLSETFAEQTFYYAVRLKKRRYSAHFRNCGQRVRRTVECVTVDCADHPAGAAGCSCAGRLADRSVPQADRSARPA